MVNGTQTELRCAAWHFPAIISRWICLLFFLTAAMLRAAEVTATLEQKEVQAGEAAELRLEIKGGRAAEPQVPQLPDFIINQGGREHQMSFFNGVSSATTVYRYAVGSMKPGDYTIPPFKVMVDGREFKTQELKLKVTPSANQQPQGTAPGTPQPQSPGGQAAGEEAGFGFLTVELVRGSDRKHVWVGEIAPERIKAWFPAESQARLNGGLQPEGSAFTLHNLSKQPKQEEETRGGKRHVTLTWFGGLSAAKPGSHLPDLNCRASVAIRDPNARQRRRGAFGDPFFDQVFTPTIQKDVTLSSKTKEASPIEVRPLPDEGKPDDFTGAVGQFQFGVVRIPSGWMSGEPQQISAEVTGDGNFALLSQPSPSPLENWRSYSGQSDFSAQDAASFAGTQRFRFNAVPKKPGVQGVSLKFSYFDPESGKYEEVSAPAQQVEVTGSAPAPVVETKAADTTPPKNPEPDDNLAPAMIQDTAVRSLLPLAFTQAFRVTIAGSVAAAVAGLLFARLYSWRSDPARRARLAEESAARAAITQADAFAARGDVPGFFAAARRVLQVRLAAMWGGSAQAITLADVADRVPPDSPVLQIFSEADRMEYGRAALGPGETLQTWRSRLQQALGSLPA